MTVCKLYARLSSGAEQQLGSGVVLVPRRDSSMFYLVTAAHCVTAAEGVSEFHMSIAASGTTRSHDIPIPLAESRADKDLDLAILALPADKFPSELEKPTAKPASRLPEPNERCRLLGFPAGSGGKLNPVEVTVAEVADRSSANREVQLPATYASSNAGALKGYSGGPVLQADTDRVYGIVRDTLVGDGGVPFGLKLRLTCISSEQLNRLLEGEVFPDTATYRTAGGRVVLNYEEFPLRGVVVDLIATIRELSSDILDDWFPDPLAWRDLLEPSVLAPMLQKRENIPKRLGGPLFVPKNGPTFRVALLDDFLTRVELHALVSSFAKNTKGQLTGCVYSCRPRTSSRRRRRGMFVDGVDQWKKFQHRVGSALSEGKTVLAADIATYYDRIDRREMERMLKRAADQSSTTSAANFILPILAAAFPDGNSVETRGLPQNRDASAYLASLYLADLDERVQAQFTGYFRYLDDIRVICESKEEAWQASRVIAGALYRKGLHLNSSKTRIICSDEVKPFAQAEEWLGHVDSLLRGGRARPVQIAVHMVERKFREVSAGVLQNAPEKESSRLLAFCLERLARVVGQPLLSRGVEWEEIGTRAADLCMVEPSLARPVVRFVRQLGTTEIGDDLERKVVALAKGFAPSGWGQYLFLLACADLNLGGASLLDWAQEDLSSNILKNEPLAAAQCILLARSQRSSAKTAAEMIMASNAGPLLRRAALLALKEYPPEDVAIPDSGEKMQHQALRTKKWPVVLPESRPHLSDILRDLPTQFSFGAGN